jgi:hypothetical protein
MRGHQQIQLIGKTETSSSFTGPVEQVLEAWWEFAVGRNSGIGTSISAFHDERWGLKS